MRFRPVNLPAHVLRGVFLFGSTMCNILALRSLQLAETTSIYFFGPMVITALAGPLLGEWAGWRRWLAILAAFAGVLIITRPGVGVFGIGHLFALGSMLSNSFYVIMTRRMSATETSESLILFSALAPAVLLLPMLPFSFSLPHDGWHWFILLMLGVFGGVGHWLLVQAYRLANDHGIGALSLFADGVDDHFRLDRLQAVSRPLDAGRLQAIIVASGLYIVHRTSTGFGCGAAPPRMSRRRRWQKNF